MILPQNYCKAWWKLENVNAEIGPNFVVAGTPTWNPARHNNGFYSNNNSNYLYTVGDGEFDPNACIFEWWMRTDNNVTNGAPADAGYHTYGLWGYDGLGTPTILCANYPAPYYFYIYINNGSPTQFQFQNGTWLAGNDIWIMLVINPNGIAGGLNTVRLYINGVLANSSNLSIGTFSVSDSFKIGGLPWAIGENMEAVMDNLKIYSGNTSQELIDAIILNSYTNNNEGWPVGIADPVLAINKPQVLILSNAIDIYKRGFVEKILNLNEKKTFKKDKIIVNQITQAVINRNNFFSIGHPDSIFSNIRWRYDTFKIINADNEIIWNGILKDIERDHSSNMATIISTDPLYKFQNKKIAYTSSTWETPATAFKKLCIQEGFTSYNQKSVQDSIDQQTENNCFIMCRFDLEDNITFQQAIEKLGEVGVADVYTLKNEIHYDHWRPFTGGVAISLKEKDLRKAPYIYSTLKDLINEYSIRYAGDNEIPATDSGNSNPLGVVSRNTYGTFRVVLDCSEGTQIVIKDKESADYIGRTYIRKHHINLSTNPRPPDFIKIEVPGDNKNYIQLDSDFNLDFEPEGWNQKPFNVYENDVDYDNENIKILALEIDPNGS